MSHRDICPKCGQMYSLHMPDKCMTKSRDGLAEEYCDQPRYAQVTRDDKAWHRMKAAFLAGFDQATALSARDDWKRIQDSERSLDAILAQAEKLAEALEYYAGIAIWIEETRSDTFVADAALAAWRAFREGK